MIEKPKLYAIYDDGTKIDLGYVMEISTIEPDLLDPYDDNLITSPQRLSGTFETTTDFTLQPKVKIKLFGISNNYIRLHGGKPLRTVRKRFL